MVCRGEPSQLEIAAITMLQKTAGTSEAMAKPAKRPANDRRLAVAEASRVETAAVIAIRIGGYLELLT